MGNVQDNLDLKPSDIVYSLSTSSPCSSDNPKSSYQDKLVLIHRFNCTEGEWSRFLQCVPRSVNMTEILSNEDLLGSSEAFISMPTSSFQNRIDIRNVLLLKYHSNSREFHSYPQISHLGTLKSREFYAVYRLIIYHYRFRDF